MSEEKEKEGKAALPCDVCLRDIEHDQGQSHEVEDYVYHFCGLECYTKWERQKPAEKEDGKQGGV